MHDIDIDMVRQLVRAQFPAWADLPVTAFEPGGWDNRTFRLGDRMSVRLPSDDAYADQVAKEQLWLPILSPRLPVPIPCPVALGKTSATFPRPWSIYRWLDGEPVSAMSGALDLRRLATDLACFLEALHDVDATRGPRHGTHNFGRGGPIAIYDDETRGAIGRLADDIDADRATAIWDEALASTWGGEPVWVHGDVAAGNLLVRDGALAAVIDFGMLGVGDPACDLAIAWTLLEEGSRSTFRSALRLDDATWARSRGWALWKALITLLPERGSTRAVLQGARRTLREIFADRVP